MSFLVNVNTVTLFTFVKEIHIGTHIFRTADVYPSHFPLFSI